MKKYLYLSVALLTTLSLGACGDDDEPGSGSAANVQFSASSYTLDDEPIEIKVVASQAAASNLNIGFTVGGTATTADDLSDVILGNRNLNRRGVVTIDDLKAHGIRVVDDLNNEIFDEIGDAI